MHSREARLPDDLELLRTPIPGPRTRELAHSLQAHESRNVTFVHERFPVFWESASGATVTDVDGNRYIDLTAAFGVANTGHANPRVAAAIATQAQRLAHAMGDVHPSEVKIRLLERLSTIAPPELSKTFLASTGAEAVEAALKTAMLWSGKSLFVSYRGAYHGLSIGTLPIAGIQKFRQPFLQAIPKGALFFDYPTRLEEISDLESALSARSDVAAIIIEPQQGRGGCMVPPAGYLRGLRRICTMLGIVLIFDEIYTGFGRTGAMFALEHEGAVPDILCVGKAMGSGFPISATIARAEIMDAWPLSTGEALHTSTYLGNPMGCAAALATIDEIEEQGLVRRARELGALVAERLQALRSRSGVRDVRGRGLLWGVALRDGEHAQRVVFEALRKGVIALQSGPGGSVLSVSPPLVISARQLSRALDVIEECL